MKRTILATISALVISGYATAAEVEDTWYGKVSFGTTDLDVGGSDTDKGFSLDLGYRLNRNFAFEGGFTDLGEASDTEVILIDGVETELSASVSTSNWSMATLATTDANREFYAGAKLGFHFWETDLDLSAAGEGSVASASDDGTDIFYGVFANWRIGNWVLGAEHTIFQTEFEGAGIDPSMTSVSLSMDF